MDRPDSAPAPAPASTEEQLARVAHQTSALLWLLFQCQAHQNDATLLRAARRHLDMLAANPHADPLVSLTCERLAAQWSGRVPLAHPAPAQRDEGRDAGAPAVIH